MVFGKLIGGLLGFLSGGLFLAILGVWIGHFFDKSFSGALNFDHAGDRVKRERVFFTVCFRMMGALAKSDGRVSEEEIQLAEQIMSRLGLSDEHRKEAIALFKEGSQPNFNIEPDMAGFVVSCKSLPNLSRLLIEFLVGIALADGALHDNEQAILQRVAHYLGIGQRQFEQLIAMLKAQQNFSSSSGYHFGDENPAKNLAAAYKALGVNENASAQEIKRKYRKLMSQHHPDKLMSQGLPEDMLKVATEKAQEIQNAYELIKNQRKI